MNFKGTYRKGELEILTDRGIFIHILDEGWATVMVLSIRTEADHLGNMVIPERLRIPEECLDEPVTAHWGTDDQNGNRFRVRYFYTEASEDPKMRMTLALAAATDETAKFYRDQYPFWTKWSSVDLAPAGRRV